MRPWRTPMRQVHELRGKPRWNGCWKNSSAVPGSQRPRQNVHRDGGGFAPAKPGGWTCGLAGRRDDNVSDARPQRASHGVGNKHLPPAHGLACVNP